MQLTRDQLAAVRQRGQSLLLSASAGSGKTGVLTRRVVDLLADPLAPCDVDQLLVVTFTRAAAAELRGRIAEQLAQRAAACEDARQAARLERQVLLLDGAEIGTIDSWCGRIVRGNFELLGIDPSFGMLSAERAALLRREALDELFSWLHRTHTPETSPVHEWLRAHPAPHDDFLRELILELNAFRAHLLNPPRWLAALAAEWSRPDAELLAAEQDRMARLVRAECARQHEQLGALLETVSDAAIRKPLEHYATALYGWMEALSDAGVLAATLDDIAGFSFGRASTRGADRPALDEAKGWFVNRLKNCWTPPAARALLENVPVLARRLRALLFCEQRFHAGLTQLKRRHNAWEFGDVQGMALQLLGRERADGVLEPTETALRLRQRYEHILVDEFQDTSPTQVALLELVTRAAPQPSNRFMVGDVKQSIYSFRLAEPRLFSEQARAFDERRAAGETMYLADNFRSHPALLNALNEIFARLFEPDFGGSAYGPRERLRPGRSEMPNPGADAAARVELHVLPANAAPPSDDDDAAPDDDALLERIEREARVIAARVHELMEQKQQVPDRGPDGATRLRPLRLDDVVVLLRSARENAPRLADALRSAGVPAAADGRESLLDALEVGDLRFALALAANLRQDLPLASYLRGPLVGLSEPQLALLRGACGGPFWRGVLSYARDGANLELRERLRAALAQVRRWRILARQQDVAAVLRQILAGRELRAFVRALPGAAHRLALIDALQSLAGEFSAGGRHSVADFVEFLDALAEEDLRPASGAAPAADRVRVMTIHAAKGLEYPIVFLANAGARFNRPVGLRGLICDGQRGLSLRLVDRLLRRQIQSAGWPAARDESVARLTDEELRLLYVAATRARELLCIVGHVDERFMTTTLPRWQSFETPPRVARAAATSAMQWLLLAVGCGKLDRSGAVRVVQNYGAPPVPCPASGPGEAPPAWDADDESWLRRGRLLLAARHDRALSARPAVVSVSTLKQRRAEALAADEAAVLFPTAPTMLPRFAAEDSVDGRAVGTAVHRFLQHADLDRLVDSAAVRAELERLIGGGQLSPEAAAQVDVDDLLWFAATPLGAELRAAGGALRREVAFACGLPSADAELTLLRGVLDGVVDRPEGLLLIDYKTDRPASERDRARRDQSYGLQMQLYALAAAAAFGRPVRQAVLVYLRDRRLVEVLTDAEALAQAAAQVNYTAGRDPASEELRAC